MRIRIITRIQAICLVLSLFLGVFALGLGAGWMLFKGNGQPGGAVEAFAPAGQTPDWEGESTPLPLGPPAQTAGPELTNLFSFATPSSPSNLPVITPAAALTMTPEPAVTPTLEPGGFRIEVVRGPNVSGSAGRKRILIYHTHTYEAYTQTPEYTYEPTEKWRTKNNQCNVVRVGEELAQLLTAAGFEVVHDTAAYEPPVLSTSYTRSLKMLEESLGRGENYDLYIDLHRDGGNGSNTVQVGDQRIARIMFLVGKGTGLTSAGFDEKPDWEKNLAIAQAITNELNTQVPDLCRPVKLSTSRYNQHIAPRCVLIEAGSNMNTLEEALASVPYLSDAIRAVLNAPEATQAPEGQ